MIVGGGIIGSYLGSLIKGEIWEKEKGIKEKPCGGLISKNCMEIDFPWEEAKMLDVYGAVFVIGNEEIVIEKASPQAFVFDRLQLQRIARERAEENGSKIIIREWKGEEDTFVIGADGALSSVARALGIKRHYIFTLQGIGKWEKEENYVWVFPTKDFFGWVIPLGNGKARIGMGAKRGLGEKWNGFVKGLGVEVKGVRGWPIPLWDGKRVVYGNKALVGDAAAQVKATSGGGIYFGMKAAQLLAKAIEKGDLQLYEREYEKSLKKELKLHLLIRKILWLCPWIYKSLKKEAVKNILKTVGDMDHPKKMVKEVLKKPWLLI